MTSFQAKILLLLTLKRQDFYQQIFLLKTAFYGLAGTGAGTVTGTGTLICQKSEPEPEP